jgi:hypothetical protein
MLMSVRRRQLAERDEQGMAMITVMLISVIMLMIVATSMSMAVSGSTFSRRDQDWNASLASARAGVDDYLNELNQNGNYWTYGVGNPNGNAAFVNACGASTTCGKTLSGSTGEQRFRYSVNSGFLNTSGFLRLTATGKMRKTTRTVQVDLRRRSFLDYLYFTDYETKDPAVYDKTATSNADNYTPSEAAQNCGDRYYPNRNSNCTEINFSSFDTINGPLHSNDAIMTCGAPKFLDKVTTMWGGAGVPKKYYRTNGGCSGNNPTFPATYPRNAPELKMPVTNKALVAETDPSIGKTGCLYTGPTKIVLNNNGTMDVTSKFTDEMPASAKNCATGVGVPLPANGVIYTQNVPSAGFSAGCPNNYNAGYPIATDITTYDCRLGNVFIEGTLKGQLTVAAENNIIVTWHLTYAGGVGGTDLLGLIAEQYVEVYHPVRCSGNGNPPSCSSKADLAYRSGAYFKDAKIQAAILSLNHSFRVQNYIYGNTSNLGTLNVTGAIAQKYRGLVTVIGSTGYGKNYVYDTRLKTLSPPKFLDPVESAWQPVAFAELKPQSW